MPELTETSDSWYIVWPGPSSLECHHPSPSHLYLNLMQVALQESNETFLPNVELREQDESEMKIVKRNQIQTQHENSSVSDLGEDNIQDRKAGCPEGW